MPRATGASKVPKPCGDGPCGEVSWDFEVTARSVTNTSADTSTDDSTEASTNASACPSFNAGAYTRTDVSTAASSTHTDMCACADVRTDASINSGASPKSAPAPAPMYQRWRLHRQQRQRLQQLPRLHQRQL